MGRIQSQVAHELRFSGTSEAIYMPDSYQVNVSVGRYLSGIVSRTWKRMPGRTHKSMILFYGSTTSVKLLPILGLYVGLEVSVCTGHAQRLTLWEALKMSFTEYDKQVDCSHEFGEIDCIKQCWSKLDVSQLSGAPVESHARLVREHVSAALTLHEHTGVDSNGNLHAWWPFTEVPCTRQISSRRNEWLPMMKDTRDVATFASISPRCFEISKGYRRRESSTPCGRRQLRECVNERHHQHN